MDRKKLIQKFKFKNWEVWLHRRFSPFVTYLMMAHATPTAFKEQGVDGQWPIALYDTDDWYGNDEMFKLAGLEAEKYLKKIDIFALTKQCENILKKGREEIPRLCAAQEDPLVLFDKVLAVIKLANLYIWIAHGSEVYYHKLMKELVKDYVSENAVDQFIGDISFPIKKNAMALMEKDIRDGLSVIELHRKYAWIKSRGGFQLGYTKKEMVEVQKKVLSQKYQAVNRLQVPPDLSNLVKEVQELVYLRTLRTDALWEMYYLAMPIFDKVAEKLGVVSLKDYLPDNISNGQIKIIPHEYAILKDNDDVLVVGESIVHQTANPKLTMVKGVIAQKGKVVGRVKIMQTVSDISNVKEGDIIVTNMTTPAYITAMHKAAAFVTNEGGITCHAAIIAREMKKPCIIGTKNATKIFKDGDLVEVDADNGVVRKINE